MCSIIFSVTLVITVNFLQFIAIGTFKGSVKLLDHNGTFLQDREYHLVSVSVTSVVYICIQGAMDFLIVNREARIQTNGIDCHGYSKIVWMVTKLLSAACVSFYLYKSSKCYGDDHSMCI